MSLRVKLLILFTALALGPLIAIGAVGHFLSIRAVTAQLEDQTRLVATRAAEEITRRLRVIETDMLLVGENAESERLLRAHRGRRADTAAARQTADAYLRDAWRLFGSDYLAIELRDGTGRVLLRLEGSGDGVDDGYGVEHVVPVRSSGNGLPHGSVSAMIRPRALLPAELLDARFGRSGVTAVVYRPTSRVLHLSGPEPPTFHRLEQLGLRGVGVDSVSGAVRLLERDEPRVGWVEAMLSPPLSVVSVTDRSEFAAPFRRQRRAQLAVVLLLAACILPAGAFLMRRATRSLDELTLAADRVGRGDFSPPLPPARGDEVGRLTTAFRAMIDEIRMKVDEIERSRQLAAIGEFAAELAHEIRNPLTAVKLNLQRVERQIASGAGAAAAARPLEIALGEVRRLERVVRGVLRLGHDDSETARAPVPVHVVLRRAVDALSAQLEAQRIETRVALRPAWVRADEVQLGSAFTNLLLNAAEAMSEGGILSVSSVVRAPGPASDIDVDAPWHLDVVIADTGGGIPEQVQDRLFRPFVTSRREGTGLGLALALRVIESHGGALSLERTGPTGTAFRVRLPLIAAPAPAQEPVG